MRGKKNNKSFLFKEFSVYHHLCAHKVGFDGVLLGAWAKVNGDKSILDLGTGCGLIALMCAQKNTEAQITGIEKDEASAKQAVENFENSLWKNRLTLIHDDFLSHVFKHKFDHIITNPPYFINALTAPGKQRSDARHISNDTFRIMMQSTAGLLTENGRLSLVFPDGNKESIFSAINHGDYYISRMCRVYTGNRLIPERMLMECTLKRTDVEETNLFVYDSNGEYSQDYIKLTQSFYPHF